MDVENFRFNLHGREYVMDNGRLTIDDIEYQEDPEDPTYDMAREIWRLREITRG